LVLRANSYKMFYRRNQFFLSQQKTLYNIILCYVFRISPLKTIENNRYLQAFILYGVKFCIILDEKLIL
jgi:hypothetical protein